MPTSSKRNEKQKRKTKSIARSINRNFSTRIFWIFFFMDLVFFHEQMREFISPLFQDRILDFSPLISIFNNNWPLLTFQFVVWFFSLFMGTGKIKRRLRPLYELASATEILGSSGNIIDEDGYRDLQAAIEHISPTKSDARLHTGNKELAGLEDAVNKLLDRMRDSYSQQARFVSDASHELRTPIAVIQGYANMLDRWGKEDETVLTESIDAIKSESDHMKHLVEQLLFLARGDSGKTKLNITVFDLSVMMAEVCEQSQMIDENHVYTLDAPEPVYVKADYEMLKQTARILVENASKYSAGGEEILLRTKVHEGVCYFTVQDNGIGMTEEDMSHIFERFFRADVSRTRGSGGTGLGLAIAKWIIDKHEGYFEITSRENLGTRISVCLPLKFDEEFESKTAYV